MPLACNWAMRSRHNCSRSCLPSVSPKRMQENSVLMSIRKSYVGGLGAYRFRAFGNIVFDTNPVFGSFGNQGRTSTFSRTTAASGCYVRWGMHLAVDGPQSSTIDSSRPTAELCCSSCCIHAGATTTLRSTFLPSSDRLAVHI